MYLDGGWQTLVDGLLAIAKNANTKIVMDKKAISVKRTDSSGWQVLLSDKTQVSAKIVVIAADPMDAYSLFDDKELNPYAWSVWMLLLAVFQTRTHCLLWG